MFQSQQGRPDISFMAVTPRLGQLASPNFSIYSLFPIQGTEMMQKSRTRPGLVRSAKEVLGKERRAIHFICAVNHTEETEVHCRAEAQGDHVDVSPGPHLQLMELGFSFCFG